MKLIQLVFPGGKRKAFTTSYDDGVRQDIRLLALMKQYGIKGTFHLNSGALGIKERAVIDGFDTDITKVDENELLSLYQGQEIAAHTCTHRKLTDISLGTAAYEILEDRKRLEEITGELVQGFSYPFGCYDDLVIDVLKSCGIKYARTVEKATDFSLPKDFLKWHPTCHHNDSDLERLLEEFIQKDALFDSPQLFYLWGHAYEFDQRNNWDRIEQVFSLVSPYQDRIWMSTNYEICNYVAQFHQLVFSVKGDFVFNPTAEPIWVSVDNRIYCILSKQKLILNEKIGKE